MAAEHAAEAVHQERAADHAGRGRGRRAEERAAGRARHAAAVTGLACVTGRRSCAIARLRACAITRLRRVAFLPAGGVAPRTSRLAGSCTNRSAGPNRRHRAARLLALADQRIAHVVEETALRRLLRLADA